jgi:two-component system sensor histidine kinase DesK
MDTVPTMPKKTVWAAGLIILALAALGTYQGVRRAGTDSDNSDSGLPTLTAPATNAKVASPLAEPITPILTEDQVRDIARQEARAALRRSDTAPTDTAGASETNGETAAGATASAARPAGGNAIAPAASRPAAPVPTPPAPAPAPAPGGNSPGSPPLF